MHPEQNFEAYPLLVVPVLYIADDDLLERLVKYAADGGHLLLTFRSGYADPFARIRWQRAPGVLRQAVGASYQEYSNLAHPLALIGSDDFDLPVDARATAWADGLLLEGATALATYDHPHFGRFPAIVSQAFGKGRVTYCGTLPNASLAQALAQWVIAQAGIDLPFADLPLPVRVTSSTARDGRKLWFFSNWSYSEQPIDVPLNGVELFSGQTITPGSRLTLAAWDTRIVVV